MARAFLTISLFCIVFFRLTPMAAGGSENPGELEALQGSLRVTYETLRLPEQEALGLAGFHYLVDVNPHWYLGGAVFGAVRGIRGGFFTGGIETGVRMKFLRFSTEAGLFVGGGGGRSAPQGGGLMVQPHAGLLYDAHDFRTGVLLTRTEFPNGDIKSNQVSLAFEVPFELFHAPEFYTGDLRDLMMDTAAGTGRQALFSKSYVAPMYESVLPRSSVKNTDGSTKTGRFAVLGVEYGSSLGDGVYGFGEAAGAVQGTADGYAQLLFGAGYALPLADSNRLMLDTRAALGAGGGGKVRTGAGILMKTSAGLRYAVTPALGAGLSAGYERSGEGRFSAACAAFRIFYAMETASFGKFGRQPGPADELFLNRWQTALSMETYLKRIPRENAPGADGAISLIGLKVNKAVKENLFVTGQAWSAYSGGAGGYAVGLFGLRLVSSRWRETGFRLFAEADAGAAGGGSVPVGGGAVVQGTAGLVWDLGKRLSIEAGYGMTKSLAGSLATPLVQCGLAYRFSTLNREPKFHPFSAASTAGPGNTM